MKSKLKVYLDTSVISALFDTRNPERKSLTESFFENVEYYSIYISNITIAEINNTPDTNLKKKMKNMIVDFSILEFSDEDEEFTNSLMEYGALSKFYLEDAYHVAIAIMNDMDFLLSWNFRHLVRKKTRDIVRMVCTLNNLRQIEIITPAELL
ncbi:MAG: PIN domain-containing protein [Promethearchaeota archaeon]